MMRWIAVEILAVFLLAGPALAQSQTKLAVDIGWGGHLRAHRWIPVMVTASDPRSRNVLLEVHWPHGGNYAMKVEQVFAIGPLATTFPLVLPAHNNYGIEEAVFTLRDADSGKTLAHYPPQPGSWPGPLGSYLGVEGSLVGVSGIQTSLQSLSSNWDRQQLATDYQIPALLPTTALGYDSLDLLVLNQPNLSTTGGERAIDAVHQQAIVDWVRAGGSLLLWPSAVVAFPLDGPIVDVLPCRFGQPHPSDLPKDLLKESGLADRFANLPVFDVTPQAGATRIDLLGGKAPAYSRRFGLGQIIVASINVGGLLFDDGVKGDRFWRALVAGTHVFPAVDAATRPANTGYSQSAASDQMETQAMVAIADQLGDVPGAGRFGFSYVVVVLVGMMIVVGPVDWFVLKKLGRQPWTWVTTSGWILLVTLGAVSIGYLLKSGDLHYRTVRTIDQVDGATVALTDIVGIYAPRTRQYAVSADPEGWWQPAGLDDYNQSQMTNDVEFHQTYQGNTPEPITINVWSLRFLRGDHVQAGPPLIAASLRLEHGPNRIVGVIKNLTEHPLKDIRVRAGEQAGACILRQEAPGTTVPTTTGTSPGEGGAVVTEVPAFGTVRVEATLQREVEPTPQAGYPMGYPGRYPITTPGSTPQLWQAASHLDMRRAARIDALLKSGDDLACVYASVVDPPAAVPLAEDKTKLIVPIQHHWQFIRALVELQQAEKR